MNETETKALSLDELAHKIRTPLSVIANEVIFLESKVGADELARIKRAVDSIRSILKDSVEAGENGE